MIINNHKISNINFPVIDEKGILNYIHNHHLSLAIIEIDKIIESYDPKNLLLQIQLIEKGLKFNLLSTAFIDDAVLSSIKEKISNTIKKYIANIELIHNEMHYEKLMQIKAFN